MIYELRINIFVKAQGDLDDVIDKLNDLKPDLIVVKSGQPDQQCSVIDLIECRHDLTPPEPCSELSHWDNCPD